MCRFGFQYAKVGRHTNPLIVYFRRCNCSFEFCPVCNNLGIDVHYMDTDKWQEYWKPFIRQKRLSTHMKPSLGTCAVFGAVDRFGVDEVGLIGFDNILDQDETWDHDAIAEKRCIESLVNVVDLRSR